MTIQNIRISRGLEGEHLLQFPCTAPGPALTLYPLPAPSYAGSLECRQDGQPPELHRLRIAAKKLRYATEFFAPLHEGKRARDYQQALARLQDALGSYNDAVKMTFLAGRASRGLRGAAAIEARGIMLGWSGGMQAMGTRHLKRVWKEFRAAKPFWK